MGEATSVAEETAASSTRPWSQAWIDALPLAPAWAGVAFAAGHIGLGAIFYRLLLAPESADACSVCFGVNAMIGRLPCRRWYQSRSSPAWMWL